MKLLRKAGDFQWNKLGLRLSAESPSLPGRQIFRTFKLYRTPHLIVVQRDSDCTGECWEQEANLAAVQPYPKCERQGDAILVHGNSPNPKPPMSQHSSMLR